MKSLISLEEIFFIDLAIFKIYFIIYLYIGNTKSKNKKEDLIEKSA